MPAKKIIDLGQVEEMAEEFNTQEEIAIEMGFDRTAFTRRDDVRNAFLRGKNTAKTSLRSMLWQGAKMGDRTLMIFLAKNELGYRDNPVTEESPAEAPRVVDDISANMRKKVKSDV